MIKVLHVIPSMLTGGAEVLVSDILLYNDDKDVRMDLLVISGERTHLLEAVESKGVNVRVLTRGRDYYNLRHILRMSKIFEGYDIVHAHTSPAQILTSFASVLCRDKRIVYITTEHSTSNRRRKKKLFKPIDRFVYSKYSTIIGITPKVSEIIGSYIGNRKKIVTICNGIDLSRYANVHRNQTKEHFTLCMVGSMKEAKDQDTIIRAMRHLPADIHLKLIGDGPRMHTLKDLAMQLGVSDRVEFCGIRKDIPEQLSRCDVYIMSSHWEGFGLSVVEAMASGLPVIASNVEGLNDVVHNSGLLFEPSNDYQLAEQICRLLYSKDMYNKYVNMSLERSKRYSLEVMLKEYIKLYKSYINK